MNQKIVIPLILVVLLFATASAGCSTLLGGTEQKPVAGTSSDTVIGSGAEKELSGGNSFPVATQSPILSQNPGQVTGETPSGRKIIYSAVVHLEVDNISVAVDRIGTLTNGNGGYIASSSLKTQESDRKSATITLRIPATEFENALSVLKEIGRVESASTTGEDISEEYVDLVARKTSYQNQIAQYNEIMKMSKSVEEILKVQEQIDRVQTDLDKVEGRIRYLNNKVNFSTITVQMQEPEPVGGGSGHNFISTLNEGISGFSGMIDFLIIAFLTLLPLIVIGVAGYGIYSIFKSKKAVAAKKEDEQDHSPEGQTK